MEGNSTVVTVGALSCNLQWNFTKSSVNSVNLKKFSVVALLSIISTESFGVSFNLVVQVIYKMNEK